MKDEVQRQRAVVGDDHSLMTLDKFNTHLLERLPMMQDANGTVWVECNTLVAVLEQRTAEILTKETDTWK